MLLDHHPSLDPIMLVQMFLSHVLLDITWLAAVSVLAILMALGIHHLQHVEKVMKQANIDICTFHHTHWNIKIEINLLMFQK